MTTTSTRDTGIRRGRYDAGLRDRPPRRTDSGTGTAGGAEGRSGEGPAVAGAKNDRGQGSIEFLGMTPMIILIMLVLWELALIGYTWSLAGNAADVGARAAAGAEFSPNSTCRREAREDLPNAWDENATVRCSSGGALSTADVKLKVPVLVPGLFDLDVKITGHAASPTEG